jgi:uncharacterized protein (DUF362 family)
MKKKLTRREFLALAASLGISVYAAQYFFGPGGENFVMRSASASLNSQLTYSKNKSASEMTREVIEKLGGINKFVKPGETVVLKPNIAWDRGPGYGANTSPEIAATVAKLCKEAGAKTVKIIDNPCVDSRVAYTRSGFLKIGQAVGADIYYLDNRSLKEMRINGHFVKDWPVYRDFIETDRLINIPVAKHHGSSKLSIGMKNWLGAIGGNRGELHASLDESIVDFASFFKPDLTIIDMTEVLVANGPRGGNLSDVRKFNTVIGGTDIVACDAFASTFFNHSPEDIKYIKMAHSDGLGDMNYKKLLNA